MTEPRPLAHLRSLAADYPGVWRTVERMRSQRGGELPTWPSWCYLPLAGAYAVASGGTDTAGAGGDVARIGALATWRATQGVYRLSPEILSAVWDTPLDGALPVDLLYRLPEWCVYLETPGRSWGGSPLHGCYAHLESDTNDGRTELRLLLDLERGLVGLPLHLLDGGSIHDAVAAAAIEAATQAGGALPSSVIGADVLAWEARSLEPIVSLILYVCSQTAELRDARGSSRQPRRPVAARTKRGLREFPPDGPTVWEVSYRLGAALRTALAADAGEPRGTHRSPRPHIRRAHWHHYWTGAGRTLLELRWIPPVPVAVGDDAELVPMVRGVE